MYARVVTGKLHPGLIDETIHIVREGIAQAAKQRLELKGALGLVNRRMGKGMAIILRETAADVQATDETDALQELEVKLTSLFGAVPVIENYEVVVHE